MDIITHYFIRPEQHGKNQNSKKEHQVTTRCLYICRLMKFLRRVTNNWFNFALHRRVYSTCILSAFRVSVEKNFTDDSGRIRTHDLLLTSADVLTSRPPSLPDDDWPARILRSTGFRNIYRLMLVTCFHCFKELAKSMLFLYMSYVLTCLPARTKGAVRGDSTLTLFAQLCSTKSLDWYSRSHISVFDRIKTGDQSTRMLRERNSVVFQFDMDWSSYDISGSGGGDQQSCFCDIRLSDHSVHWESLLSPTASKDGSNLHCEWINYLFICWMVYFCEHAIWDPFLHNEP